MFRLQPRHGLDWQIEQYPIHRGTCGSVKDFNAKVRAFVNGCKERCHSFM